MTGKSPALTTVVLPVWDEYVTRWLPSAVSSLQSQDVTAPVVVVDNASEVELPELPDTHIVRSPSRLSRGAARDLGLAHVRTPYVVMWDADDVMPPGTISFLEHSIDHDPHLAAFGMAIVEDGSGRRHRWPRPWIARLVRLPRLFAFLHSVWSLFPAAGATIMRTEWVRDAGGYGDVETGEDWLLGVSLAYRGRIGWSEQVGRVYRLHAESNWARHASDVGYQLDHARSVRRRLRADDGLPAWGRMALPLIQLAQYGAIALHQVITAARRARSRRNRYA